MKASNRVAAFAVKRAVLLRKRLRGRKTIKRIKAMADVPCGVLERRPGLPEAGKGFSQPDANGFSGVQKAQGLCLQDGDRNKECIRREDDVFTRRD